MAERKYSPPQGATTREIVMSGLCPSCRKYGKFYNHTTAAGNKYVICSACGYRYKTYGRKEALKKYRARAKKR